MASKRPRTIAIKALLKIGTGALLLSFPFMNASADTVTSISPAWVLLPNSIGPDSGTWALPANTTTCGNENSTTCEPIGDFIISSPLVLANGPVYYKMIGPNSIFSDDNGMVSDIVTIANTGPGGTGEIKFSSDPNSLTAPLGYALAGTLCTEVFGTGCIGTLTLTATDTTTFTVKPASDDEGLFDPFGFKFDSSDQIQFNGITPVNTPEPASLLLLGTGLVSFAGLVRRRLFR